MQKMKFFALLLSVLMMLTLWPAMAEEATLIYSYGEEASLKHLLEVPNIVKYKGEDWVFDFGDVSFDGAFTMYGGNVRTVWGCEVPEVRVDVLYSGAAEYMGKVTITAPSAMTLYAFSGDRTQGKYTLTDTQEGIYSYALDLYATRDESGTLRLIDTVFLYSYELNGVKKNYAASVYVSYAGYTGAPADTAPVTAVVSTQAPAPAKEEAADDNAATYAAMIRILDEERNRLAEQVTALEAEIAALKASATADNTLQTQVNTLTAQLTAKNEEVATLQAQVDALTQENAEMVATIAALKAEAVELPEPSEDVSALKAQIEALEKEIVLLRAGEGADAHEHHYECQYYDEKNHRDVCTICGAAGALNAHGAECPDSGKCSFCGAAYNGQTFHWWSSDAVRKSDDTNHWFVCEGCGTALDVQKHHSSPANPAVCADCGAAMPAADAPVITATPVPAPVVTATPVPAPVVTATPVPAPVVTATPVPTPVVTATPVPTPVVTATPVPTPVVTATPVPTPVVTATPVPTATPAPLEIAFKKGQEVEIFNQNGVKIKFTGEVEDRGTSTLQVHVLVENQYSEPIRINYTGSCNGWSLPNAVVSGNANSVAPNTKAQGYLWFKYDDLDISKFSDMTDAYLTFTVCNSDSYTELFKIPNVHIIFGTGEPEDIVPTYFEYYPELPDPTAYGAMYQSSRSGPTLINGVPSSSVTYKYRNSRPDDLAAAFDTYLNAIKAMGFSVSRTGTQYTISHKGEAIAKASCSDVIVIEILPTAIVTENGKGSASTINAIPKKVGDTLSTSFMTFKAAKYGKDDYIYSYENKEPNWYRYYEAQSGSTFVYLKGTFTNKTNVEVDIRNIYTNLLINNEYNYKGDVTALRADGNTFINYVPAQATATCYVYFEVPDNVVKTMKSAVIRLGFTPTFNTKVSQAGSGTYKFENCSDVFDVTVVGTSSSTNSTSKNAVLKIVKQPPDASAPVNKDVKTTVEATGNGLTYTWYWRNPDQTEYQVSSSTTATYSCNMTNEKSGREVYCVITDSSGKSVTSDIAILTVEKKAEPITFQNISWGSSPDTARSALVKAGYISSKGAVASFHDVSSGMLTTGNEKDPYELPYDYEKVLYEDWIYDSDIKKRVGGHDVESISLLYTYGMKNGKINKDKKELISINIELKNGNFNDLTEKLTALYGKCVYDSSFARVWKGSEDTCVILYPFANTCLLYGKWDNLSYVKDMYAKLGYGANSSDSSGL